MARHGDCRRAPASTLKAFRDCLNNGWGIACNLRQSVDGQLLIWHSDEIEGLGRISELSLADIRNDDVRVEYLSHFQRERILTLEELYNLADGRAPISLRCRGEIDIEKVAGLTVAYTGKYGVFVYGLSAGQSARLKEVAPELLVGFEITGATGHKWSDGLEQLEAIDVFLVSRWAAETKRLEYLLGKNKLVIMQDVDDELWARVACETGASGIISDEPSCVARAIQGIWRMAATNGRVADSHVQLKKKKGCLGCSVGALVAMGLLLMLIVFFLLPALSRAMEEARKTQCRSNLRQIGLALTMYANDNDGWLPAITPEAVILAKSTGVPSGSYIVVSGKHKRAAPTGLGLIWSGGYLTSKGAQIMYCPSCNKTQRNLSWRKAVRYDSDEPFWTTKDRAIFPGGDNDGRGDIPWDGVRDEIISNYTLRPAFPAGGLKLEDYLDKAVACDILLVRPYGPETFLYQNHEDIYNVLFGDGKVVEYKDSDGRVARMLAWTEQDKPFEDNVRKVFEEVFDTINR